jgi:hypothetical protein
VVAHRCEHLEAGPQRAQGDLEAHLVVAGRRAAVRDRVAAQRGGLLGHELRLQAALGADAQRVQLAAADVAEHQVLQHRVEELAARVHGDVALGAERQRAGLERRGVDVAAGVHGHRDHRAAERFLQPGHAERRVQAAGEGEQNGTAARGGGGVHGMRYLGKILLRRASRACWPRAEAVATKIVSSPEIVPDDLLPAGPVHGDSDALRRADRGADDRQVRAGRGPAGDEARQRAEIGGRTAEILRRQVALADLGDAEVAQVAADAGLCRGEAARGQQLHELGLASDAMLPQEVKDGSRRSFCWALTVGIGRWRPGWLGKDAHYSAINAHELSSLVLLRGALYTARLTGRERDADEP